MLSKALTFFTNATNGFLSLIYPNNCVVCDKELPDQIEKICFSCRGGLHYTYFEKYTEPTIAEELFWGRIQLANVYSLLFYEKGNSTQSILHKIKYQEGRQLGILMGGLIGEKIAHQEWVKEVDGIIPIPLHSKKAFKRGYNQSLIIGQGLSTSMGIPLVDGLRRKRHHESQTKKSKEERWENVKSIFGVNEEEIENKHHLIIVDDVLTTGSTLEAAARTILNKYPNIQISLITVAIAK